MKQLLISSVCGLICGFLGNTLIPNPASFVVFGIIGFAVGASVFDASDEASGCSRDWWWCDLE